MADNNNTVEYSVTALPFAVQHGTISVSKDIAAQGEGAVRAYIEDKWDSIQFGEPDLDYCGADFDISEN